MSENSADVNNGFHFIWFIENIDKSFNEEITSPTFIAHNLNQSEWSLSLRPLINQNSFMLVLGLTESENNVESITIDFIVYVSISEGRKDVLPEQKEVLFRRGSSISLNWSYELTKNLYKEDLKVYCQMQTSETVTLPYICCSAFTLIDKKKRNGVWKVKKLTDQETQKNRLDGLPTEARLSVETQQILTKTNENDITPQTLKDDLKKFYKERKHCDITLQTESVTFPAHRSILCSRSPVFSAMFSNNMKEAANKKVEIDDVDADTLDAFLLFLYSETLEDLQWNQATKLLYAANKYQVESLKKECSSYLMSHITASNVCEALVLADLYQDDKLRTQCQDFTIENASEIFPSKEWEVFTVDNPLLSAKMLQKYFSMKK